MAHSLIMLESVNFRVYNFSSCSDLIELPMLEIIAFSKDITEYSSCFYGLETLSLKNLPRLETILFGKWSFMNTKQLELISTIVR